MSSLCKSCGAEILWAETPAGGVMPLDARPLTPGLVNEWAFNPRRGTCQRVEAKHLDGEARAWADAGATFHTSHWATCPHAAEHRIHPEQQALEL